MSISLAPGEEVTIEQRTFTKMEQSFEETQDSEVTKDQELSSSYTNELSESLDWQLSTSNKSTNANGGKVSGSYEGIGVEASTQTANDLTDGDTRTARDSVKLSESNTRKVASKQRQQHKTVMRLSQESRFESGSKRVLRNANSLAPIDLVYFKVLQRLQVSQERYGIRLCWAPAVADPGERLLLRWKNAVKHIWRWQPPLMSVRRRWYPSRHPLIRQRPRSSPRLLTSSIRCGAARARTT